MRLAPLRCLLLLSIGVYNPLQDIAFGKSFNPGRQAPRKKELKMMTLPVVEATGAAVTQVEVTAVEAMAVEAMAAVANNDL